MDLLNKQQQNYRKEAWNEKKKISFHISYSIQASKLTVVSHFSISGYKISCVLFYI